MRYRDELNKAMLMLAEDPKAIFLGQSVACPGTAMFNTLEGVPMERRLEMPVAEGMQAGMATGISLAGGLPISIYPRWDFVLLAASQLVSEMDKLPIYSDGGYRPKVIVRTAVPTRVPLDPGPQHMGDHTDAFISMFKTVRVRRLEVPEDIMRCYLEALEFNGSTLLVEFTGLYDT